MLRKLHQRGLNPCFLSGDKLESSHHLAERLGIDAAMGKALSPLRQLSKTKGH